MSSNYYITLFNTFFLIFNRDSKVNFTKNNFKQIAVSYQFITVIERKPIHITLFLGAIGTLEMKFSPF